jgi:two-component system, probable response regulator PhcQ
MYRVLLIDDEPNILSALRRCLGGIDATILDGDPLKVETFTSPEDAIARCEDQEFDLVISDYRMPSMNGVEVLERVMELQPSVPRMIISGFADRDAIISAINQAHLTRFIDKPWDDKQLRQTVASILSAKARGAGGDHRADSGAPEQNNQQMERLEQDSPGITQVDRTEAGGIVIAPEDWAD